MRKIHEISLRRLEQIHRRHLLEYEEKAMRFEEHVVRFSLKQSESAGEKIRGFHKQGLVDASWARIHRNFVFGITGVFWFYLTYAYPYNEEKMKTTVRLSSSIVSGAVWSPWDHGYSGKNIPIRFD